MFVVPAFCMAEDEEAFSQSSFHAKCLNPGTCSEFPATLQNHTQGGSCAAHELYGPGYSRTKFEVLQKTKLSSFSVLIVLLVHLIMVTLVFC